MNGLFVASEFAIVTARRTRITKLVEQGNRWAVLVQVALNDQNRYIAATQLGITMASLGLGAIGEPIISSLIVVPLESVFGITNTIVLHSVSFALAFAFITSMHIILGELAPKSVALWHPERTAMWVIPPTHIFLLIFKPFIWLMNESANLALGIVGLKARVGHHVISSEDFSLLASESEQAGAIGEEEARIVRRAFRFAGKQANDIMVPRTVMQAVPSDAPLVDISEMFSSTGFTRLPVYDKSLDHVIGVIHSKDILVRLAASEDVPSARSIMRSTIIVPESKDLAELLEEMRSQRTHLAIVVDEYGVTAGMVSMEDLIEEIIGEISSEHRSESEMLEHVSPQMVVVDAAISVGDLNEQLDLELGEEGVNTLGGFVFHKMGRVPDVGETFTHGEIKFEVLAMEKNRVSDVRMSRVADWPIPKTRESNGGP